MLVRFQCVKYSYELSKVFVAQVVPMLDRVRYKRTANYGKIIARLAKLYFNKNENLFLISFFLYFIAIASIFRMI